MAECLITPVIEISNEDHNPTPPPLEPILNHHTTTSNPPTPLGILSTLPRELRDEIYRHLHDHRYYFHNPDYRKWRSMDRQSLPTMRLSKVIREEFLAILFAEADFCLSDSGFRGRREANSRTETWIRDDLLYIDRIQNVSYSTGLLLHLYEYRWNEGIGTADDQHRDDKLMLERSAEPISFLTGTEVLRNSCVIYLSPITPKATLLLQSPLIDAVKGLTGFMTVILILRSTRTVHMRNRSAATDHAITVRTFAKLIRATLEGSLGPSAISEVRQRHVEPVILGGRGYHERIESKITFHPQDYASREKNVKSSPSAQRDMGNKRSLQEVST